MANGTRPEPLRSFNFYFESGGILQAGFMECTGLSATVDALEVNEGGLNTASHKLAGRTKHNNITLKRGVMASLELYAWFDQVMNGRIIRRECSIVMLDLEGVEKARWNLVRAFPVKWTGPDLNSKTNDAAIEQLELAHEGIKYAP